MRSASTAMASQLDASTIVQLQNLVTITSKSGVTVRWTDCDTDLVEGGRTFTAGGSGTAPLIEVGNLKCKAGTGIDSGQVTLKCGEGAQFGGMRLPLAVAAGVLDGARVIVEWVVMLTPGDTSAGTLIMFDGYVGKPTPSSAEVVLEIESGLADLNRVQIPRKLFQPGCSNQLGDSICGYNLAANTVSGTVASSGLNALQVVYTASLNAFAAGWFELGVIAFTSGSNAGESRTVTVFSVSGSNRLLALDRALPAVPAAGDAFTVYPGCDGARATCINKFNNHIHFRGEPFAPKTEV